MAIKQGAIRTTTNPTPIIHSCTATSSLPQTVSDYSDRRLRFRIKEIEDVWYFGAAVPKTAFSSCLHPKPKNKSPKVGMFLSTTQTTISRPR
jgi:hypothetical protein